MIKIAYLYWTKTNHLGKHRPRRYFYACVEILGRHYCVHTDGETYQRLVSRGAEVLTHEQHIRLVRREKGRS